MLYVQYDMARRLHLIITLLLRFESSALAALLQMKIHVFSSLMVDTYLIRARKNMKHLSVSVVVKFAVAAT